VRFAVGLPNVGDYGDPRVLADLAGRAEAAGWDGIFIWDHLAYRDPELPVADPWIAVAAIATATERVRIGVLVCALARRRPWKVARETASLDVLSGGRLVFGAGLGSLPDEEFAAFGEEPDARIRAERLDEGLEIVTGLWRGEPVSFRGRHYEVETARFTPVPVQRPRIPVWIAGRWPARPPFRRAARWDGVFPTHRDVGHAETMTVDQLAEIVDYTRAHRGDDGPFDVVVEGQTDGRDPDADGERVAAYGDVGLTWWIEKLGWYRGSLEVVRERIELGPPRARADERPPSA
jgi:alkanesulfonate monooxygenase SsuD/methylene tetrahydromethanopterin reductase-like flavin-dependent oxidoreductase (luciferase family)